MKKIEEFRGSRDTQDIGLYLRKEDFERGEKLGLGEGEKHGFEKGEKHKFEKTAVAIAMIKNKETDEKIMKETGLSIEEITRLRKLIEN
jgi:predicted transposase YdaD